jgi:hypothetical protein
VRPLAPLAITTPTELLVRNPDLLSIVPTERNSECLKENQFVVSFHIFLLVCVGTLIVHLGRVQSETLQGLKAADGVLGWSRFFVN